MRPMAGSEEALEDLKRILDGRAAFYAKADMVFDTSVHSLDKSFIEFKMQIITALNLPI